MRHQIIDIPTGKSVAKLYTYVLDNFPEVDDRRIRPAIVICPGGSYEFTTDREAEPVAVQMNALGFQAFVLKYSVSPFGFPTSLLELATAVALIRENQVLWHVDPEKIVVLGFSAGGHLAASLGVFWNQLDIVGELDMSTRLIQPNGLVLCYPVISSGVYAHRDSFTALLGQKYDSLINTVSLEKQVSSATPPTFLWHTYTDEVVPCENSLLFASALRRCGIPIELHIFPNGGHGLSLGTTETLSRGDSYSVHTGLSNWVAMAARWIRDL